ncbi:MAG: ORF6N domain-containing protein [Chlorobi bacterium]|nr:ORF6N domain-containing protein [Chlorobiota bacterium]
MEEEKNKIALYDSSFIKEKIHSIRNKQVMLDSDLAELYGVEPKRLNEQVRRNIERFPKEFRFQLTKEEHENLKSQIATSSSHGGRRYLPYVFTEQGIAMLSAVLHSKTAINTSVLIIQTFVEMRRFIAANASILQRIEKTELKQIETDKKIERIFNALQSKELEPKHGIFYDGQIFDAHKFVSTLVRKAKKSILLIDNYVDESTFALFSKKKKNVAVTILTKRITKALALDEVKFNEQYSSLEIKKFTKAHDRFLIIDDKDVYHFGASLKDLGKKWFAFSKLDKDAFSLLENLKRFDG